MGRLTISIEAYGEKHSIEMGDEANLAQTVRAFANLITSTGYSPSSVSELFKDGDPNFWEDAQPEG